MKYVGVICEKNTNFLNWKIEFLEKEENYVCNTKDTIKKFIHNDTTYICITKPHHCIGYSFDEVIELYDAYKNKEFFLINNIIAVHIKPKKL